MLAPDLGELAYGSGDVVVWPKEVLPAALGEAAALPICGAPAAYSKDHLIRTKSQLSRREKLRFIFKLGQPKFN